MNLIFLGPPGAGKGTHATRLATELDMEEISTGDLFRAEIRAQTPLGVEAQRYIERGELVPDRITIDMVRAYLPKVQATGGYILDGFPRTVEQAKALHSFAHIDGVVSFELPDAVIIDRLTARRICANCGKIHNLAQLDDSSACPDCGGQLVTRKDDNEATVRRRLEVYHQDTEPLVTYYRNSGLLRSVDSDGPVEQTYSRLRNVLGLSDNR
jgi:adenylate kinase